MTTVEEVTARLLPALTAVPPVGLGVCDLCHGWTETYNGESFSRCTSCTCTVAGVQHPSPYVVPITLYKRFDTIHDLLWGYKNSAADIARATLLLRVAALLARFIRDHSECIRRATGGGWDTLTIVPSSGGRGGTHPLEIALLKARAHRDLYEPLLRRVVDVEIDHRQANERAYEPITGVQGKRILLVDDTFTTGARVHSAASALTTAGAVVVATVVAGRFINPDYHPPESDSYWTTQKGVAFAFEACCLG